MGQESIKLELIEWITGIEDQETIQYLKRIKDAKTSGKDRWAELSSNVQKEINQGLEDVDKGRVMSHEEVKEKYSLRISDKSVTIP